MTMSASGTLTRSARRATNLRGLQDELDNARRLPDWHGAAGENTRNALGDTRIKAETLIAELSAVERALQNASDDVSALKTRVSNSGLGRAGRGDQRGTGGAGGSACRTGKRGEPTRSARLRSTR